RACSGTRPLVANRALALTWLLRQSERLSMVKLSAAHCNLASAVAPDCCPCRRKSCGADDAKFACRSKVSSKRRDRSVAVSLSPLHSAAGKATISEVTVTLPLVKRTEGNMARRSSRTPSTSCKMPKREGGEEGDVFDFPGVTVTLQF